MHRPDRPGEVGAVAREAADAEGRCVGAARPLLLRPVALDHLDRVECSRAEEARHPLEDESLPLGCVEALGRLGLLAGEERAEHAGAAGRRRVVVHLAHELVRSEPLACEPFRAPERLVVDGEHLDHVALGHRLVQAHPPRGQRGLEADQPDHVRRHRDDRRAGGHVHGAGIDLDAAVVPAQRPHGGVEDDAVAEPLGQPERDQLRAADDAGVKAEVRLEQVLDAACAGDRGESAQHREGVGRLRHVAAGHERPQQVACQRVVDLGLEPLLEADRVELGRARVLPRCLGVELGGQGVELGDGLLVGAGGARREDLVVAVVAVKRAVGVDVEVVALAVGVEELDPELGEQRVHLALVRRDPLAAELVRLAADLDVQQPAADAVARLEHDHLAARRDEVRGRREAREARADDDDICVKLPDHLVRSVSHRAAQDGPGRHLADRPGLAADAPVLRVVAFDDHPRVVAQVGVDGVAERVGHPGDELLAHLRRDAVVEQLDADQRHDGLLLGEA